MFTPNNSRRLVKFDANDQSDEEENATVTEEHNPQNIENTEPLSPASEALPIQRLPLPETASSKPKAKRGRPRTTTTGPKAKRGRPKKNIQEATAYTSGSMETSGQAARIEVQTSKNLDEIDFTLEHVEKVKRRTTAQAYRLPLAHWKVIFFE